MGRDPRFLEIVEGLCVGRIADATDLHLIAGEAMIRGDSFVNMGFVGELDHGHGTSPCGDLSQICPKPMKD